MGVRGKGPALKMKPKTGPLLSSVVAFFLGLLFLYDGHRFPGDIPAQERSKLIFAIMIVVSGLLFILSTGRMWFKHLWTDRYTSKRRGSSRR